MKDIYFDENYGKLYEEIEKGKAIVFECKTKNGSIRNQFIKRKIPIEIDNSIYYDIITPYGYGGPIITECTGSKEELLQEYEEKFSQYCKENNVVSEFVRFHPIYKNYIDFKEMYNAKFNRYTLATNLKDYDDPVNKEFSKHCRKTIREVQKREIFFNMVEHPEWNDVKEFMRIYYLNMTRKKAEEYYFFNEQYFKKIYDKFKGKFVIAQAIYENKIVAAGLYFVSDGNVHAHLSGTDTNYLHLSPAYILKYGTVLWAKEHSMSFVHYGGGTSSDLDDPLYNFKSKFAQNTKLEFWIGKKVWNKNIYNKLCEEKEVDKNIDFFPAYRK